VKRFRPVVLLLVLALLLTPATALAAPDREVVYTALGDSIAAGFGGTDSIGYVDLLAERLSRGKRHVTLNEQSANGMTSGDLLARLADPGCVAAVADADIITVSIGGNDILQPVVGFVQANPRYADPAYLSSLTPQQRADLLAYLHGLVYPGFVEFSSNWPYAIGRINQLNGTAKVYVNTVYNPFKPGDGLYEIVDPYVAAVNGVILAAAPYAHYTVVDVYTAFGEYRNPSKPLVWGLASTYALHPTDRGYRLIYTLHKQALNQD
jgi:lysophospholipase L1-like esterase